MTNASIVERILGEGTIGCAETARILGSFRNGRPVHSSTVSRLCQDGVRLADGRIVRLEHFRSSGKIVTSRAAIIRFLEAQQDAESLNPCNPVSTTTARRKSAEAANRELELAGA